jgi:hypothetical protein
VRSDARQTLRACVVLAVLGVAVVAISAAVATDDVVRMLRRWLSR